MRLSDLDLLIAHYGVIFGKAFDPSAVQIPASTGEGQSALEYSLDHGLSRALAALGALQTMARTGRRKEACALLCWAGSCAKIRKEGSVAETLGRDLCGGKGKKCREKGENLLVAAMKTWETL